MMFYNTNQKSELVSLREAVLRGLARDGGLFMPQEIPKIPENFFKEIEEMSFVELSFSLAQKLFGEDVPRDVLERIVTESFNFPVPLVCLEQDLYVLELFHGPTLAFKDFAARFMARLMVYLRRGTSRKLTVLVATSGDTGSAVANGFFDLPGIDVIILYPSGKVSEIQEKQLTTMGKNIKAFEVCGTFDDCQRLVKQVFLDEDIKNKLDLASANSINIARLFPQIFYYFYAYAKLPKKDLPVVVSVPSGNFGNLTAGLLAKKMGLPINKFVAATNMNDVVLQYLVNGIFEPRKSKETISNAMDVGNPSNFARLLDLYDNDVLKMRRDIVGLSFTDDETRKTMRDVFEKNKYILDPHGAVAYLGLKSYFISKPEAQGVFIETAHPVKFLDIVKKTTGKSIDVPLQLRDVLKKEKQATGLSNNFDIFKEMLLFLE